MTAVWALATGAAGLFLVVSLVRLCDLVRDIWRGREY